MIYYLDVAFIAIFTFEITIKVRNLSGLVTLNFSVVYGETRRHVELNSVTGARFPACADVDLNPVFPFYFFLLLGLEVYEEKSVKQCRTAKSVKDTLNANRSSGKLSTLYN